MRTIDLTMPIAPHWRFSSSLEQTQSHERGNIFQISRLTLGMHGYTHVDAPRHCLPGGPTIEAVALDTVCGEATVLDLGRPGPNTPIGPHHLSAAGDVRPGSLVLLRSCWEERSDPTTREFWLTAPYLTGEAAAWLADRQPRAVGFDFPQDYVIRELVDRQPPLAEFPTHQLLLARGVILIEYLVNLGQIPESPVLFFAAPLLVPGSDGAPARALAYVE
jgi:kynurenine formamidase